ncbi:hypothetical protein ACWOFR_05440 [Carnobacterium gallinarum]|uniref:hypothetical protein n=1 Tax=Carnobacterium gallinarum TaxID=2749 RepID=UPI00054F74B4|nr:hypothetical protein [Carnobacterium gallinarum]
MLKKILSVGLFGFFIFISTLILGGYSVDASNLDEGVVFGEADSFDLNGEGIAYITKTKGRQPRYLACPGGGRHNMVGNATGRVINNKTGATLLNRAYCFRCTKCGLIIISQNSPILGAINLGYYATGSGGVANHTVLRTDYGLSANWKLGNDSFTQSLTWAR